ncbi:MFS transporter [Microbacterium sp. YMB-B2]|uniref:MFS transporter n=1 Tax=Microbacterium tenebrionis TaxID=2830665 RepID=A0A9X1LMI6_9MICO|nr:MFS transporter [Microbacterium tenebrionis]MCC2028373.1 MFS transporter [Microbacterium tenebrionis]
MTQTGTTISPAKLGLAWAVVAVVLLGDLLDLLDSLVTTIAGPSIVRDLGGGDEFIQWLAAGYTLAMAAGLLIGARLGDMFGRKRMFLTGITGFTLASLLAALAVSPEMLVAVRIAQGSVGAMMVPQALGLIKQSFPPDKVGVAFGLTGPVLALGGVAGPIVAGWLVDANYFGWGWRMIFAINVPVGIAIIIAGAIILPASTPDRSIRLDVGGALLAAVGMGAVVFGLVHGRDYDWAWWVIAIIVAGVACLIAFALTQRVRGRAGNPTLVTPSLFSKRAFLAGLGVGACFFGAMMGSSLMFALFFQLGMGLSPLQAGLAAAPQAVGMIVGFVLSQVFGLSRRTMFIGFGAVALGFAALIVLTTTIGGTLTVWPLLLPLGIVGIGMGLAIAPFFDIVLAGVDDSEVGSASGSLTAVQQLGNAVGVAALGTIFFTALTGAAVDEAAYAHALSITLGWAIGLVVLVAAITALLPRRARENAVPTH